MDLSALRQEYANEPLTINSTEQDPLLQFQHWFSQALRAELVEPNAMVLATVDERARPASRTVLLKYFDSDGLVFFTNYESRKATHIKQNPSVSLLFQWLPLSRQVEINGEAIPISRAESLAYFLKRPRDSQLGAWVSAQSQVISGRKLLEGKLSELKQRFAAGEVPLPSFWGGYRVRPRRFEFWQGGAKRLHDRIEYRRIDDGQVQRRGKIEWNKQRLAP